MNNQNILFNDNDAILYGTCFKSLYIPYKDYKCANVKITTDKEKELFDCMKYYIFVHDLGLYLDVYPQDQEAVMLRSEYLKKYLTEKEMYDNKYPPYDKTVKQVDTTPFSWSTTPFPWGDK